jgi:hypothetical protein
MFRLALIAALLPAICLSAPTAAGSKHNVYLTHCQPTDCSDFDCDPEENRITAAAYFANGPITDGSTSRIQKPTTLATINQSAWEGTKRTLRLGTAGSFTSNISSTARTAAKGTIAGDATLGTEPFVCFKDGTTKFSVTYEYDTYTCTTDYWCPSTDVGTGDGVL